MQRQELEIEEPQLPRRRKAPRRFEQGTGEAEFHATPKGMYRQTYFEVLDSAVASITARFDQPGYKIYSSIEKLLFKACMDEDCDSELCSVCDFYGDDLDKNNLQSQLQVLRTLYLERTEKNNRQSGL